MLFTLGLFIFEHLATQLHDQRYRQKAAYNVLYTRRLFHSWCGILLQREHPFSTTPGSRRDHQLPPRHTKSCHLNLRNLLVIKSLCLSYGEHSEVLLDGLKLNLVWEISGCKTNNQL